ncbi:ribbon-helix-helix domain-containing protein [Treponema peruense]|uniref:CopG family transcriptional regulator n=1 Tax=Treponema peruense TaxID=2787628 RepID=A0A7T3RDW4_9SPIR|nr:ribbon-helix-helix domain-containing protein [Treponema peruense]QQA01313.1 CopG family transcriptional regulator [Treponema peruense]
METVEHKNWGGKRSGQGRPKGSQTASKSKTGYNTGRIVISCLESEVEEIKKLAAASGKSVSRFIIDSILN